MLTHEKVWSAIDALADRNGMSPSGLAKRAGLDPTAFNRSKRHSSDGRPRWPSTESLSKVMQATGADLAELLSLVAGRGPVRSTLPVVGFAKAGTGGYFDDGGFPVGEGWDTVEFPVDAEVGAYAIKVQGESMLPVYRDGDILIVEPGQPARRGDRVVVKTTGGEVMAKVLQRQTAEMIELVSLNPEHEDRIIPASDIEWIARIVWASQ